MEKIKIRKTSPHSLREDIETMQEYNKRINTDSLTRKIVQKLPSDSVKYTFNDGVSRFINGYRTACSITEDNGEFYQSVTNSGNSNTYRRAYLSCAELMNDASKILVEFDTKFAGRWQIGLVDLEQRPGESTGTKYTSPGVAFYIGTSDGTSLFVNNAKTSANISGIWIHVRAVIDFSAKTTEYVITNRETGVVLNSGTVSFRDAELTGITGFEVYTWTTGTIVLDNIEIIASYDAQDNVIYIVPADNDSCRAYVYLDGKPVLIGDSTPTQPLGLYCETPQQVGAWIDGTPVWRMAFDFSFKEYFSGIPEDYAVTLDDGYFTIPIPIRDDSPVRILTICGAQTVSVTEPTLVDDVTLERDYESGGIIRVKLHTTYLPQTYEELYDDGIYGYIEFVTPASNVRFD